MKFKREDKVLCMNSDFEKKVPNAKFPNGEKYIQSDIIVMSGILYT